MTQQRSNDEIRADIATVGYTTPDSASGWWATERLAADVPALLARVSELEQENVRLHGVIAHTASDVHDYVRAALADARTERDATLVRAERAEAERDELLVKVAAVEALLPNTDEQFPIFPFQIRDALGADPSGYILIPVASLAAGLSLQEEQE